MKEGRYASDCPASHAREIERINTLPEDERFLVYLPQKVRDAFQSGRISRDEAASRIPTGYIGVEYHQRRIQEIREQRSIVIPARFRSAVTDEEFRGEAGMYLWGDVGVGKTYRAAALALQAIEKGYLVGWLTATSWLSDIKASWNGGDSPATPRQLADKDLLVIDDLGAEKPSEWAIEQLYNLVNLVYEQDVLLLVTSNKRPMDLTTHLGKRIVSRLTELCEVQELGGEDRRLAAAIRRRRTTES